MAKENSTEKHVTNTTGKNSPVKLDRMEFFTPTISFPSDLQGSVSATLTQETASQLKESYTSLSVDGKKLT